MFFLFTYRRFLLKLFSYRNLHQNRIIENLLAWIRLSYVVTDEYAVDETCNQRESFLSRVCRDSLIPTVNEAHGRPRGHARGKEVKKIGVSDERRGDAGAERSGSNKHDVSVPVARRGSPWG